MRVAVDKRLGNAGSRRQTDLRWLGGADYRVPFTQLQVFL